MESFFSILILSIILVLEVNAQADCIFEYCYIGSITNIKKNNKVTLLVPSPEFMLNILGKKRGFRKVETNNQLKYENTFGTIESSVFCKTSDQIIEKIFKGDQKFYTIYVIKGKRKYKRKINIQDIQFYYKDEVYYINLPSIKV